MNLNEKENNNNKNISDIHAVLALTLNPSAKQASLQHRAIAGSTKTREPFIVMREMRETFLRLADVALLVHPYTKWHLSSSSIVACSYV